MITVDVADVLVKIDLRVVPLAVAGLETSPQDVAIINADFFGGMVEGHLEWSLGSLGWFCRVV
jgi:hypothetical protein